MQWKQFPHLNTNRNQNKYMRNATLLIIFFFTIGPVILFAQTGNSPTETYLKTLKEADSLIDEGLPEFAIPLYQACLKIATQTHNTPLKIKASVNLITIAADKNDSDDLFMIHELNKQIATTNGIEKAIWQSYAAEAFQDYYDGNRYELFNRTTLAAPDTANISTWNAAEILNKAAELYTASIQEKELLQAAPEADYSLLITKTGNTQYLRPTLYDLLAFKAIHFFENDASGITQPQDQFEMDGTLWFEPAERFSEVKVKVRNAEAFKFQALRIYQQLLAFHLKDKTTDALIDADLNRLDFVHNNSVHPQKDSLYKAALIKLSLHYKDQPGVAQVHYLLTEMDWNLKPLTTITNTDDKNNYRNLPAIKSTLENIIKQYPKSEGASNAATLLNQIEQQELSLQVEEVYIPDENIKALINYKNLSKAYFKLYKVAGSFDRFKGFNNDSILNQIRNLQPVKEWTQDLIHMEDMEQHNSEIKIDALPVGAYVVTVNSVPDINIKESIVAFTNFQVSNISFVVNNSDSISGYVLNRKTGYPIVNAHATFFSSHYNSQTRESDYKIAATRISNQDGLLDIPSEQQYDKTIHRILLKTEKDTLFLNEYLNNVKNTGLPETDGPYTSFFFTDRAIYRPGQTIYFKGILLHGSIDGRRHNTQENEPTRVTLYDANQQKIADLKLETNEYGSVSGKFTIPEGVLTGQMHIGNENGQSYFRVEEYKRPKFHVDFDTLKGAYTLNETATVKGFAKAYAGNNIDAATVKYRVVRRTRFPFYWCFYKWGMPQAIDKEIINGSTTTDADGAFEIQFETSPDKAIEPKSLPVFTYTVYADVTDINGETRSNTIDVKSGYTSLQIKTNIEEESKPKDLDSVTINTQNLNGNFIASDVQIKIARLKFPGFLRNRLWPTPNTFILNESDFRKAFPNDEYKDESNHLNWEIEKVYFEKSWTSTANGTIKIPEATWYKNGWYLIEIKTKDAQGNDIIEKKYTHVWAPAKKEENQQALIAYTDKNSYEPGEQIKLWVATGIDQPHLLHDASIAYKVRNPIYINVQEKDRGGMNFSWLYVSNNRVYSLSKRIDIPWSNKELQLEWATHRDKLLPGEKETWTLTIKGSKKEKVAAELLTGLYDASLDAFSANQWSAGNLFPQKYQQNNWLNNFGFGIVPSRQISYWSINSDDNYFEKEYDGLSLFDDYGVLYFAKPTSHRSYAMVGSSEISVEQKHKLSEGGKVGVLGGLRDQISTNAGYMYLPDSIIDQDENKTNTKLPSIRANLQETAFFFPQLKTDTSGNVSFTFTMPEALTEWKMMAFAHTKDWQTGYLEGKVKTQKDLMVIPNLPRFFRQNDSIVISTKISNLSNDNLSGTATLEILDALTLQPLQPAFGISNNKQTFTVSKGQSTAANWNIHIPESRYEPVVVRITAQSGNFSDGEENTLPVITNRVLVTETMPLFTNSISEKHYTLDKLTNTSSNTLVNYALTVEYTSNPAWYAVQALPYLMEYPYECAEQTFNRFYANALAQNILAKSPKVQQIFEAWQGDSTALLSNLEKNAALKSALLEETPWVMEAKNETEQKQRIARLFETHQLTKSLKSNLEKLQQIQLPDGSFPWFKGMQGNRFITQYILSGLGKLAHLNIDISSNKTAMQIVSNGLAYVDEQLKADYKNLLKDKADTTKQQIAAIQIQYLYLRSLIEDKNQDKEYVKALNFFKKQAGSYWPKFNPGQKAQLAIALSKLDDSKTANQIIVSLKQTAIEKEETGMYWKDMPHGYYWYEAPIEAQALLIEAFSEVSKDTQSVEAMKLWLLKQKQTQNWGTTKATADACYALLLNGSNWLESNFNTSIQLGNTTILPTNEEAGTGYFKKRIEGRDVKSDMGHITLSVTGNSNTHQPSWGAVYWQYFEDINKITGASTNGLNITKQLYLEQNSANGPVLTAITKDNELKVGDKVKIRIVLKVDRNMEYVHLKDMRAACFEPIDVLSNYQYQNGIGYYQSTKDLSTNFFFDYLPKGNYVFEYAVWVNAKGNFSNGISSIQCMYAPEFSSHSEGTNVKVE